MNERPRHDGDRRAGHPARASHGLRVTLRRHQRRLSSPACLSPADTSGSDLLLVAARSKRRKRTGRKAA
jgi:hypothetical protein